MILLTDDMTVDSDTAAYTAAHNGIEWLQTYPENFNDPGIPWVLNAIATDHCISDVALTQMAREAFTPFIDHPIESAYIKLLNESAGSRTSDELLRFRKLYFDDILIPALYCSSHPVSHDTVARIKNMTLNGGYETSHAYLALTWMHIHECSTPELEEIRLQTAMHMVQEQKNTLEVGDLYVERVAFLQYGGHHSLIKESWIEATIAAASPSGGWSTKQGSQHFGITENPHTTILATWAITQYIDTCPL